MDLRITHGEGSCEDLEVDFAEGLAGRVVVAVGVGGGGGGSGGGGAGEAAEGVLADDLGGAVGVAREEDAVGPVDLVVGEHAVAEREPARAPALADVGPLVQHPGHRRRVVGRGGRRRGRGGAPAAGAVDREAAERVQVPSPHRGIPLGVGTITLA
jgi:hypothetical protein